MSLAKRRLNIKLKTIELEATSSLAYSYTNLLESLLIIVNPIFLVQAFLFMEQAFWNNSRPINSTFTKRLY